MGSTKLRSVITSLVVTSILMKSNGQDVPFIEVSPEPNPCSPEGHTIKIPCVTKLNVTTLSAPINAVQEWRITFSNNSQLSPTLQSNNPLTFPPGWQVDVNSGLTIMDVGLDLDGTKLVCVAVGIHNESPSEAVYLSVGGKPGDFSCNAVCSVYTCHVSCTNPETKSCTSLTSTSLIATENEMTTTYQNSTVNFIVGNRHPNTSNKFVVTANNIVGSTSAAPIVKQTETIKPINVITTLEIQSGYSKKLNVKWTHPPDQVDGYSVSIGNKEWTFNSFTDEAHLSIDSLPSCNENGLGNLVYNAIVTANNSLGEEEAASSANFYIGYLDPNRTSVTKYSAEDNSITLNVSCFLSALPHQSENIGCQVCNGLIKCTNINNPDNQQTIEEQHTFYLPENEQYEFSVYAIDNSSIRLDNCAYRKFHLSPSVSAMESSPSPTIDSISEGNNLALTISLVVVGVILMIIILIICGVCTCIWWCYRKRKKLREVKKNENIILIKVTKLTSTLATYLKGNI